MYILGIESTCDETAAAVVEDGRRLVSNVVATSVAEQALYGGVVPEIASRRHIEHISATVQAALDEAVAYSKQRVVGGQPICKKGVITAMLADMEMQVQSARQMVWAVCRAANAGIFDKKLTAVAKCFCSDAAMKVTTDAVQIFGGNGYSKEYPVEKLMRDAKIFQIFEGTNQIQRDIIGRQLVK